jgi:uncharacterized protein YraI
MRRFVLCLASSFAAAVAMPAVAAAADAVVTADLNMRAGPSTNFPVVGVIPDNGQVDVHGCVRGYNWCDVTWRDERGWVSASYLEYYYQERYVPLAEYAPTIAVPIIEFSVDTYWDSHYRHRSWYGRRAHWRGVWQHRHRAGVHRDRPADRIEHRRAGRQNPPEHRKGAPQHRVDHRDMTAEPRRKNRAAIRRERAHGHVRHRQHGRRQREQVERRVQRRALHSNRGNRGARHRQNNATRQHAPSQMHSGHGPRGGRGARPHPRAEASAHHGHHH